MLNEFCKQTGILNTQKSVKIFLTNGFQKKGYMIAVGPDGIVFRNIDSKKEEFIFLHAISTISV